MLLESYTRELSGELSLIAGYPISPAAISPFLISRLLAGASPCFIRSFSIHSNGRLNFSGEKVRAGRAPALLGILSNGEGKERT
jgi:hypothetical protein